MAIEGFSTEKSKIGRVTHKVKMKMISPTIATKPPEKIERRHFPREYFLTPHLMQLLQKNLEFQSLQKSTAVMVADNASDNLEKILSLAKP